MLISSHPQKWFTVGDAYRLATEQLRDRPIWPKLRGHLLRDMLEYAKEHGDLSWHEIDFSGHIKRRQYWSADPEQILARRGKSFDVWAIDSRRTLTRRYLIQVEDFSDWLVERQECYCCRQQAESCDIYVGEFVCRDCRSLAGLDAWQSPPDLVKLATIGAYYAKAITDAAFEKSGVYASLDRAIEDSRLPRGLGGKSPVRARLPI